MPDSLAAASIAALQRVLESKPNPAERPEQLAMIEAVAAAIEDRSHLLVEAGTGTGKSLAYLIPPLIAQRQTIVATATKALQDQLAGSELPFLDAHLGRGVTWAVVKGRQSYVCMAKLAERFGPGATTPLLEDADDAAVQAVAAWAEGHPTGDRDDLDEAVPDSAWRELSVPGMECPGAERCPQGTVCFAEAAVQRAQSADVVVTNHHLFALHLASGRRILPDHDLVILDEAHKLEGALSSAFGVDIGAGRLTALASNAHRLIDPAIRRERDPIAELRAAALEMDRVVRGLEPARLDPSDGAIGTVILAGTRAVSAVLKSLVPVEEGDPYSGPVARVVNQGGHVAGDFTAAFDLPEGWVSWAEPNRGIVRVAPIEVADALAGSLLVHHPVVLTSATLAVAGAFDPIARRLGFLGEPLPDDDPHADGIDDPVARTYRSLRVEGSFDYAGQGLLYVASHLPDPRTDEYAPAALEEIAALTAASEGRALILTTSFRMLDRIAAHLAGASFRLLVQGQLPKKQLLAEFSTDEKSSLVATMGFWEGIDVPGRSLSLVVIDRLPFPRPDDPLFEARREVVAARGGVPFNEIDLPLAAVLLAQGAGRLIRNELDRGVVAVLDSRIDRMGYGRRITASLPRFLRTRERERAVRYLKSITAGPGPAGDDPGAGYSATGR